VTAVGAHEIANPKLAPITLSNTGGSTGAPADQPVGTIRTAGSQILAAANLIQYHAEQTENVRGSELKAPVFTIDGSNRHALVTAQLAEFYGNGQPIEIKSPMRTVTSHDRECVVCAHMDKYYAGGYSSKGNSVDEPVTTITVEPRQSLVAAHVVKFKGTNLGQKPDAPLQTITAETGEFAACAVKTVRYEPGADLGYWPEVRALLNKYCGYTLEDNEVLLIPVCGGWYYIRDITMRMLIPRELYAAMGFPKDYIIERDYTGKAYPKSEQVHRCGNAVCPPLATAVVKVNLAEWAVDLNTMEDLNRMIAV
jgi:DNA (cytosine-5)-methyltransferase 1